MKTVFLRKFIENYPKFSKTVQDKFQKQLNYLLVNTKHPSLNSKKYDKKNNIWQARVDRSVRFYFYIKENIVFIIDIKNHPK